MTKYGGVNIQIEKFNGQHYEIWARTVEASLRLHQLWYCATKAERFKSGDFSPTPISGTEPDIICLGLLQSYVDTHILAALPPYESTKELWDRLKERYAPKKQVYKLSSGNNAKNK